MKKLTTPLLAFFCVLLASTACWAGVGPGSCGPGEVPFEIQVIPGTFAAEIHWEILDSNGTAIASTPCGFYDGSAGSVDTVCFESGADYTFNALDDWGDGWNGGTYTISSGGCVFATGEPNNQTAGDAAGGCGGSSIEASVVINSASPITGCTNTIASNYNSCATVDDGSCILLGCTDSTALNYDSTATQDDNSCLYPVVLNDSCKSALAISCGDTIFATTQGATNNDAPDTTCITTLNTAPGVWYSVFGDGSVFTASLCGSSFDTKLGVFTGECGSAINCIAGNDDNCGFQSEIDFATAPGVLYLIYVSGFGTNSGDFQLSLSCGNVLGCTDTAALNYNDTATIDDGSCVYPAPVNDLCENGLEVFCGDTVSGTTLNSTTTGDPTGTCGTGVDAAGVWYTILGTGDEITISTCGSAYDTRLNVYSGTACDSASFVANCIGGNDDFCGTRSSFSWNSVAGTSYQILVNGWNGNTGDFDLVVSCASPCQPLPGNDICANAMPVSIVPVCDSSTMIMGTNVCATAASAPAGCDAFGVIQDVWYSMNSGSDTVIEITINTDTAAGGASDLEMAIWDACGGNELLCLTNVNNTVQLINGLTANTDYLIQVWNAGGVEEGTFEFCIASGPVLGCTDSTALNYNPSAEIEDGSCVFPAPVNDDCSAPLAIACGDTVAGNTSAATVDTNAITCVTSPTAPGVWYSLQGDGNSAVVSLCGSGYDTKLSIFSGGCDSLVCVTGNDDECSLQSEVSFTTDSGTTYLVFVHGFGTRTGAYTLSVSCGSAGCTDPGAINYDPNAISDDGTCVFPLPANDSCVNAMMVTCDDTIMGTTNGATLGDAPQNFCGTTLNSGPGVWYSMLGTGDSVLFSLCGEGTDFDTKIGLFSGDCDSVICESGNDDACGLASEAGVRTIPGKLYYAYVTGFSTNTGNFELIVDCLVEGCTNPFATNYDPNAEANDGSCIFPAANDSVCDAIAVACGDSVAGNTQIGSVDNVDFCGTSNTAPGLWYSFMGTGDEATFSLCGSTYDTKISVFSGTCDSLDCVGGNDDDCSTQSSFTTITTPGEMYWVLVHGFSSNAGEFTLSVSCVTPPPAPANDLCDSAMVVACGDTISGTTIDATPDNAGTCVTSNTAPGVWYMLTGDGSDVTASLCGSSYDTKISVFTGGCGALECVGGNDDDCGVQSSIDFSALDGVDYYILVHGFSSNEGDFDLTITCAPPANDECANAAFIACGDTVMGSTSQATADTNALFCGTSAGSVGVWYSFIGNGDDYTASLCNSDYDTKVQVYEGGCDSLSCVAGNDDACSLQSEISFSTVSGTEYLVYVTGFNASTGVYELALSCSPPPAPPANDSCTGAIAVVCGDTMMGNTDLATADNMPTCGTSNTSPGVWYMFSGDGSAVTASLCGSDFDTKIGVFSGSCATGLTCVAGNDDACSLQSSVDFTTTAGTDYYILVHGFSTGTGDYTLTISCEAPCSPVPANDDCSTAEMLMVGAGGACTETTGTTFCATAATGTPPSCDLFGVVQDVWYSFNSGNNTEIALTLAEVTATGLGYAIYDSCGADDIACDDVAVNTENIVSGLDSNTMYWIQIWTSNVDEGDFTICLSEVVACPVVVGLDAPVTRTGFADLTWDCDTGSTYVLQGNEVGRATPIQLNIPAGCNLPLRVSGLDAGTEYWWQVKQICSDGSESIWSAIDTFATQCDDPDSTWTTNITANGAVLNWNRASGANGYEVRGRKVGGPLVTLLVSGGANTSRDVTGFLQPGNTYEWQVRSRCSVGGWSAFTSFIQFTTPSGSTKMSEESYDLFNLAIYPNPASNNFVVKLEGGLIDRNLDLVVIDMTGREMLNVNVNSFDLMSDYTVDAADWAEGMYQVRISDNNGFTKVEKLMIAK